MADRLATPPRKISLLLADVDGTLVTDHKVLTEGTRAAVRRLRDAGIAFAITSSRPPRGLAKPIETLQIATPIAGFNGGMIVDPDMRVREQHLLPADVARRAVEIVAAHGTSVWVFNHHDWLLRDPDGPYIAHEELTVQFPPTVVSDFGDAFDAVGKIVGVSEDFDLLARCEVAAREALGERATVARSQLYYLDFTHPLANKGTVVLALSRLLSIPVEEIATIGDGANDIPMFDKSGFSIAMGDASPAVRSAARVVTDGNDRDGFAKAVARYILREEAAAAPAGKRP